MNTRTLHIAMAGLAAALLALTLWVRSGGPDRPSGTDAPLGPGYTGGGSGMQTQAAPAVDLDETASTREAVTWQEPVEVASRGAHVGPWRMNDSDWDYVDDPAVDLGPDGGAGVAWAHQTRQDLFFQRYDQHGGERFPQPVNVSGSPDTFSWLPQLRVDPEDPERVYVLWQEIIFSGGSHGGEILFARSTDGGATFSEPENLSQTRAGAGKGRLSSQQWDNGSLDLALGPEGVLYAVWTEYEGRLRLTRSTDGGRSFSEPVHIAGSDEAPARGPRIAVDPEGAVHVAWTVGEDRQADIHMARSAGGGLSFSEPVPVAESPAHSDAPALAVDDEGRVHLIYAEQGAAGGADGEDYGLHYVRSDRPAGEQTGAAGTLSFSEPRRIPALPGEAYHGAGYPALHAGPEGELFAVWHLYAGDGYHLPDGLGFAASPDGGESFSAPEAVPGVAGPDLGVTGSLQGRLMDKLAAGEDGQLAVVNSTFARGVASHIWKVRGRVEQ